MNDFVLSYVPHHKQVVSTSRQQDVLLFVKDAFGHETCMSTYEASAQLTLIDIKHIHNCVIRTCCKPWIILCECNIIYWEEVVFEFMLYIICHFVLIFSRLELYRAIDMSSSKH